MSEKPKFSTELQENKVEKIETESIEEALRRTNRESPTINPVVRTYIEVLDENTKERLRTELNLGQGLVIHADLMGFGEGVQFRLIKSILDEIVPEATFYITDRQKDETENPSVAGIFPEYHNCLNHDYREKDINDNYEFWKKYRDLLETYIPVYDNIERSWYDDKDVFPMHIIKPFNIPSYSTENKELIKKLLGFSQKDRIATFGSGAQFKLIEILLQKGFKIIIAPRMIDDCLELKEKLNEKNEDKEICILSERYSNEHKSDVVIADNLGFLNSF